MEPISKAFIRSLEAFAAREQVPLLTFAPGQRKDDVMAEYLARFSRQEGLECGQEFGVKVGEKWIESEWVAEGLTPDADVKKAFVDYLDEVRVAPLRPYTLYNSWYDLRSPEFPKIPPENRMSESSAMKMADILRTNMIDRYGINLDAFVLDDGWDVYDSDWVLRPDAWPKGLKPLADRLAETRTNLGIWLGPTGGYSLRKRRLDWMTGHGYEAVNGQLCVAGKNYGALLKRRVHEFAAKDGVGYFKWDAIGQYGCTDPNHLHGTAQNSEKQRGDRRLPGRTARGPRFPPLQRVAPGRIKARHRPGRPPRRGDGQERAA